MRKLKHVEARVAQVLAEVPVDDRHEREAILAQLRENYAELESCKAGMSERDLKRFEDIGKLIERLEKCGPAKRSS